MLYQLVYRINGRDWATPLMSESSKKAYIEGLAAAGIEYTELQRPEKKWQCGLMVFDLQKVDAAKKAVRENRWKEMKDIYTFGDEKEIVKTDTAFWVQCQDEQKIAYAVGVWKATAAEIKTFKAEIGYKRLGPVIRKA